MSPVRALAVVDTGAVERNCARLVAGLQGGSTLCAVVKADGYGHGAAECARAALAGGAAMLGVATAVEAAELRAGLADARILVLGALSPEELTIAVAAGAEVTAWRRDQAEAAERAAEAAGEVVGVHVKHDSGMGRLGQRDAGEVLRVLEQVADGEALELAGLWTHFATADEAGDEFMPRQLESFQAVVARARDAHPNLLVHAANSAATLREPASHFDMVRCGVAIYGLDPFGGDPAENGLEPALELRTYLADVKRFEAGASAGYGRTWIAPSDTLVGVAPIGYGDGVRRGLSNRAQALVAGRRCPLAGTISMDNVTIDLGPSSQAAPGDEVVLIGRRGAEAIRAEDLADALNTINYEVTCGISARVPREYVRTEGS